ncbi:hypothetical protein P175DRAFT_0429491 [Aspergillus ochraceoroseus IBT 24754]|uniref:N-acetylglucosamine-induced protein n=3 Tax=Aspergillus subgen. Nidulantes TaxID=2720870 RepID=A0A0F8XBU9_9EURO|nr:uncharacterized protein P175DRAFT_0429491 [Aspergillus ochraceoroseus IBT 24754]KKK17353.1 hypothetical protein AOCH_004834 [Aspergillus ochraceoroseus]KKK21087.1 hypothetical protein ARAM_005808 [Aspergillus rambellii]PTU25023.1 hypothetical protein P175DRAFT_0429491 [Aspergillus ochraceoroseus IBT 24754]
MANAVATLTAVDEKLEAPGAVPISTFFQPAMSLPYWMVNVHPTKWTIECPSFLRNLSAKNISILSTPDEQYQRQGWKLAKQIVESNQIDRFQRLPSDLRKYLEYKERIIAEHGSVMRFVVRERLQWGEGRPEDLMPKGRPFEFNAEDIRILYNDWPYGLASGIVHLVVWTKFELEDDPATDDLTPHARQEIDEYVQRTFCTRMPPNQVIWFKNWKSLKSVHAIEHFHVMLRDPDPAFIQEITGGDVPLIAQVG